MALQALRLEILRAVANLLRPVALVLLKSGITWREFAETAQRTFVDVAGKEFGIRGRPTNRSRVSILTGLDRRVVARLRQELSEAADGNVAVGFMSKPTQLLAAWYQDSAYVDEKGQPRDLPIEGPTSSFTELMRRIAPTIPVGAMVKELRAVGAIEELDGQRLRVLKRTYIPRELSEDRIRLWGSVLSDVGATIEHNMWPKEKARPRFERRATSLSVDRKALVEFEAFLSTEGQAFLERVDDWLAAHSTGAATSDSQQTVRLGVGMYQIMD
jgi:hypothetical protein